MNFIGRLIIIIFAVVSTNISTAQFFEANTNVQGVSNGVSIWGDYDNDGDNDLFVAGKYFNLRYKEERSIAHLYQNDGNGNMTLTKNKFVGVSDCAASWGDFDSDGDLDLLLAGKAKSGLITIVYQNDAGKFTEYSSDIQGIYSGDVTWCDIDNDADLDFILCGFTSHRNEKNAITRIYKNEDNEFIEVDQDFPPLGHSSVEVADFDKDNDFDIILSGYNPKLRKDITYVYLNHKSTFAQANVNMPGIAEGKIVVADFNNDKQLDVLLTGGKSHPMTAIFINEKLKFTKKHTFTDLKMSTVCAGDFDNNGRADIVLSGFIGNEDVIPYTKMYFNYEDGFREAEFTIPEFWLADVSCTDCDKDGKLDIFFTGYNGTFTSQILINETETVNTPPETPYGIVTHFNQDSSKVYVNWNPSIDKETPSAALGYNVYFSNIFPDTTTFYTNLRSANTRCVTERLFSGLKRGVPYYCSIQTSDNGGQHSPFAKIVPFIVGFNVEFDNHDVTICQGESLEFINKSTYVKEHRWQRDGITFSTQRDAAYVFTEPGRYVISLVGTNGEFAEACEKVVTVNPAPYANVRTDSIITICQGAEIKLETAKEKNVVYKWMHNNEQISGSNKNSIIVTKSGAYRVKITNEFKCIDISGVVAVNVMARPLAQIGTEESTEFCNLDSIILLANYSYGLTYQWMINGHIIEDATESTYIVREEGEYQVLVDNINNCESISEEMFVKVNALPQVTVYAESSIEFCIGDSTALYSTAPDELYFQWNKDGFPILGGRGKKRIHVEEDGKYSLVVSDPNGCKSTSKDIPVVVYDLPEVVIENDGAPFICGGKSVIIQAVTTDTISYEWLLDSNKIENETAIAIAISRPGIYRCRATDTHGCWSISEPKRVEKATIDFLFDAACAKETISFRNYSTVPHGAMSCRWYFDGENLTTNEDPSFAFEDGGVHRVKLVVNYDNVCTDIMTKTIEILPRPNTDFVAQSVCVGNTTTFINNTTIRNSRIVNFKWDFADGKTLQSSQNANQSHIYKTPGNYIVSLITSTELGCRDTITKVVRVENKPEVKIKAVSNPFLCGDKNVRLRAEIENGDSYQWYYEDNMMEGETSVRLTAEKYGNYKCVATNSGGCTGMSELFFVDSARVDFEVETKCAGKKMKFKNFATSPRGKMTYKWDFDNKIAAEIKNPEIAYEKGGEYNVKLTVQYGDFCKHTITKKIYVFDKPTSDFSFRNMKVSEPVLFKNNSTINRGNIVNYNWVFGDGTRSNTNEHKNIEHTYYNKGTFRITLTTISDNNCIGVITQTIEIKN